MLTGLFCSMCEIEIGKNQFGYIDDHLTIEKRWGYGSQFDNEVHNIILCESCYKVFVRALKIPPSCV